MNGHNCEVRKSVKAKESKCIIQPERLKYFGNFGGAHGSFSCVNNNVCQRGNFSGYCSGFNSISGGRYDGSRDGCNVLSNDCSYGWVALVILEEAEIMEVVDRVMQTRAVAMQEWQL